jgi:DNA-binding response OmpR family regulator
MTPLRRPTLLVVDDDASALEGLALALEGEFQVRTATGAAEALALIREDRPELLLLDHAMPGGNGLWLLEQLRHDPRPVPVMLSAEADLTLVRQALRLGAQDLLAKPCDLGELVASLREALQAGKQGLGKDGEPFGLRAAKLMARAQEQPCADDLVSQQVALALALRQAALGELPHDYAAMSQRLGL